MTFLDAAYQVLKNAGEPLHYREIAKRALDQGLIDPKGRTPEATMGSRLYVDTQSEYSRFVRVGRGMFDLVERDEPEIERYLSKIMKESRRKLLERLHRLDPEQFETLVGELLIKMGFEEETVQVTRYSRDGGIDVRGVFRPGGMTEIKVAVQVKRHKSNLGSQVITSLRGSLKVDEQGIIITTSDFTPAAKTEANSSEKKKIGLINGKELVELLMKHEIGVRERVLKIYTLDEEWWEEMGVSEPEVQEEPANQEEPNLAVAEKGKKRGKYGRPKPSKPHKLLLFGNEYPIKTWKEVLVGVVTELYRRHPEDFMTKSAEWRGKKRAYISSGNDLMHLPHPLPGTNLWVETNFSAKDVIKHARKLLSMFGYDPDHVLEIE